MVRTRWTRGRVVIGSMFLALALGVFVGQPAGTLAGFGSSPGVVGSCSSGEHVKTVILSARGR